VTTTSSSGSKPRASTTVTFVALSLSAMTFALVQSMVAPALPELQHAFRTSQASVSWILTSYLLSASIATPILGRLGDALGKKRVLVGVLAAFGAGTLVAAIATALPVMIVGRLIQGAGGAIFPLAFGIIRDEFPSHKVSGAIGFISALLGVGGGIGIVISGPISNSLGYHWLFWLPAIVIGIALAATVWKVPESIVRMPGKVSILGAFLLAGWLVALLLGVSQGPSWGWTSGKVLGLFALAAVIAAIWIRVEFASTSPLVDMRMMRLPTIYRTNIAAALFGFSMYASMVMVPQFVETPSGAGYGFGASVTGAGLFMLPSSIAMLIAGVGAGSISSRFGSKTTLLIGSVWSALSTAVLAFAHDDRFMIYVATALMGIGIGFAFAALSQLVVGGVPANQTGVASGMNTNIRTIGGSLGTTLTTSIATAGVAAGSVPHERGYTLAFIMMMVCFIVAGIVSATLPGGRARRAGSAATAQALAGAESVPMARMGGQAADRAASLKA
jgi:EmrB/QacA subfamily drug resistance transporter